MALLVFVSLSILVIAGLLVARRIDFWQATFAYFLYALVLSSGPLSGYAAMGRVPLAVLLLALTFRTVRHGQKRPWSSSLTTALWFCVVAASLSILSSYARIDTIVYTALLILLVTLVQQVSHRRWSDTNAVVADLSVAFWAVSLFVVAGFISSSIGIYPGGSTNRVAGFFGNPNMQGNIAALAGLLGIYLWATRRNRIYLLFASALAVSAFFSGSRTAIAALGVSVLVAIVFSTFRVKLVVIWIAGVLGCTLALVRPYSSIQGSTVASELASRVFSSDDLTLSNRTAVWDVALQLIVLNPYGLGFGVAPLYFSSSRDSLVSHLDRTSVHNSYLQWVLESGWMGAIPLTVLLCVLVLMVIASGWHRRAVVLATVILAGLLIQATESMIFGMGQVYPWLYWLIAGSVATLLDIGPPETEQKSGKSSERDKVLKSGSSDVNRG